MNNKMETIIEFDELSFSTIKNEKGENKENVVKQLKEQAEDVEFTEI